MPVDRRGFIVGAGAAAVIPWNAVRAADTTLRIPLTLTDNRVLVDCSIDGHGPYHFVLDTGGTIGLIDMKLASSLRLRSLGSSMLGLAIGRRPYPIFEARNVDFAGQVRQPSAAFAGVENFAFHDEAVGSLAAGVITAVDGELDFAASEWRTYRGETPDRTGWTRYDKAIVHSGNRNGSAFIFADVELGGKTFRFGLDTGMPNSTRVYRKTAEAAGIWDPPRWSPTAPDGKGRIARIPAMGLAGTTVEGVLVTMLDKPEWGVFDAGIVGLPVLRRFNIATGIADSAVYLKRNGLGPQAERYNRAGMWIERDGKNVRVAVVGAGSPAERAGLQPGDRLSGMTFGALIDQMFGPAGNRLTLTAERAGARRDVVVELADFL